MIRFLHRLLGLAPWHDTPTVVIINDRRPFTDDDAWKPFPFQDGQIIEDW